MPEPVSPTRQLPRGRHGLPRETVIAAQRDRILDAMADAMVENGYVGTSVASIIKRAGVSRETFYEQFRSKEDCFDTAFERAVRLLLDRIMEAARVQADSLEAMGAAEAFEHRMDALLTAYLEGLASEPAYARLYLVEVYAVGPEAIARRAQRQEAFVALLADIVGARTEQQHFACQTLVAALSAMVTTRIAAADLEGLRALREPMLNLVRRSGDLLGSAVELDARPVAGIG
ncbi:TetR/AcrR family transcriptional regulator [Nocardia sp. BMG51109]|uniref:TetR/AcrR family transcriptional regulator n=1 Tax=Nocardia sp. BMG51109 TaxID=1056816 RepID=UPI000465AA9C|nr:TetR/AcrR family transcriptional regulator [Nocardia sp. BMG51109]